MRQAVRRPLCKLVLELVDLLDVVCLSVLEVQSLVLEEAHLPQEDLVSLLLAHHLQALAEELLREARLQVSQAKLPHFSRRQVLDEVHRRQVSEADDFFNSS